ncbi:MAG TPA: NAD(P)-dependent oxidoreductase [Phycisphaerae bacterium]|nr:NAD(P)-dependent oxidoreductase [Phycisphaerae bacterium]
MTVPDEKIFLTGGEGRLGTELRALMPGLVAPTEAEMDITDPAAIAAALDRRRPAVLVHAAAYTDVAGAEIHRDLCWRVNVAGTRHVAAAAHRRRIFLVHISTDYVFEGTTGGYAEDDPVGPVRNYYSLSKLVAEELARTCPRHLVIRTSFRPREWPYTIAFTDLYTSQDYVDVIAPEIATAIRRCREIPYNTVHIATERKSVYTLAKRRKPDVRRGSKSEGNVQFPDDISLDTSRWRALKAGWSKR